MRLSTRATLIYVAVVGLALGLARLPFRWGCVGLVFVVVATNIFLPVRLWRLMVGGGLIGIEAAILALSLYASIGTGFLDAAMIERRDRSSWAWTYVGPIGFLIGGTLALALPRGWTDAEPSSTLQEDPGATEPHRE